MKRKRIAQALLGGAVGCKLRAKAATEGCKQRRKRRGFVFCVCVYNQSVNLSGAVLGLSCCTLAFFSYSAWASPCSDSSCYGAQAVRHMGFSGCGAWDLLPQVMWDLPGPGIEPVSPTLTGGFSTTDRQGSMRFGVFKCPSAY